MMGAHRLRTTSKYPTPTGALRERTGARVRRLSSMSRTSVSVAARAKRWPRFLVALSSSLCFNCHHAGTPSATDSNGNAGSGTLGSGSVGDAGATLAPWTAQDLGDGQCLAIDARGEVLGLGPSGGAFLIAADGTRASLGTMPDGSNVVGGALGANGEVVGFAESNGRVAVRRTDGTWRPLSGLPGTWSVAASIDDDGQIVGTFGTADGEVHAFLWKDGQTQSLPLSPTDNSS